MVANRTHSKSQTFIQQYSESYCSQDSVKEQGKTYEKYQLNAKHWSNKVGVLRRKAVVSRPQFNLSFKINIGLN